MCVSVKAGKGGAVGVTELMPESLSSNHMAVGVMDHQQGDVPRWLAEGVVWAQGDKLAAVGATAPGVVQGQGAAPQDN